MKLTNRKAELAESQALSPAELMLPGIFLGETKDLNPAYW
jgi:hypothetical protein